METLKEQLRTIIDTIPELAWSARPDGSAACGPHLARVQAPSSASVFRSRPVGHTVKGRQRRRDPQFVDCQKARPR